MAIRSAKVVLIIILSMFLLNPIACSCGEHPDVGSAGPVGPKTEHQVVCECGIDFDRLAELFGAVDQDLHLDFCLPPDLNTATADPDRLLELEAMPDAEYETKVREFCDQRVSRYLEAVLGYLNSDACGHFDIVSGDPQYTNCILERSLVNYDCDVPCGSVVCEAATCDPDNVVQDTTVYPEFCKCTNAAGCGVTSETICHMPVASGDPTMIHTSWLTKLVSSPITIALDHEASSAEVSVWIDTGLPWPCDTLSDTARPHAKGFVTLYGVPCPYSECDMLMDMRGFVDDFGFSFECMGIEIGSARVTNGSVVGGTNGNFVHVNESGFVTVPRGTLHFIADGIQDGNQRRTFASTNSDTIVFQINWESRTFQGSIALEFVDAKAEVNLVGTIENQPPLANAGPDQTVECSQVNAAPIILDGSASTDPDGNIWDFRWWREGAFNPDLLIGSGSVVHYIAPLGITTYQLTVMDQRFAISGDKIEVMVNDTTPPDIQVVLNPVGLWPPNHEFWEIKADVTVKDICDPSPTFVLESITSSEPDDWIGEGHTQQDIQGAEFGTPDLSFLLRAERSGIVEERVYTVVYTAMDSSGNISKSTTQITVPHDQGR